MSDRACNYCVWQNLKRTKKYKIANAKERQKAWQEEDEFKKAFGGGVVIIDKDTGEFARWFMALPERCAC